MHSQKVSSSGSSNVNVFPAACFASSAARILLISTIVLEIAENTNFCTTSILAPCETVPALPMVFSAAEEVLIMFVCWSSCSSKKLMVAVVWHDRCPEVVASLPATQREPKRLTIRLSVFSY